MKGLFLIDKIVQLGMANVYNIWCFTTQTVHNPSNTNLQSSVADCSQAAQFILTVWHRLKRQTWLWMMCYALCGSPLAGFTFVASILLQLAASRHRSASVTFQAGCPKVKGSVVLLAFSRPYLYQGNYIDLLFKPFCGLPVRGWRSLNHSSGSKPPLGGPIWKHSVLLHCCLLHAPSRQTWAVISVDYKSESESRLCMLY